MAFLDSVAGELMGPKSTQVLREAVGAKDEQIAQLVATAVPLLLSGMHENAGDEAGAAALAKALADHAGDAEKSTAAMLKKADVKDGKKIVKHVLGDNEKSVTKGLSKATGLSGSKVTTLLAMLAPVVLSLFGSHAQSQNTSASSGLAGLLGGALLGNSYSQQNQGGLDLSSLAGTLLGGGSAGSSGGGIGSLLGGLFGGGSQAPAANPVQQLIATGSQSSSGGGLDLSGLLSGLLG